MDGRGAGAGKDNVFIERIWRTVKCEEVYLRAYDSVSDARRHLDRYMTFYNGRRPRSSLDRQTPDAVYFEPLAVAAKPKTRSQSTERSRILVRKKRTTSDHIE